MYRLCMYVCVCMYIMYNMYSIYKLLYIYTHTYGLINVCTHGRRILPQLDEFCLTTAERKFWKIARCIVPNFIND
jgi:hypothetical protein